MCICAYTMYSDVEAFIKKEISSRYPSHEYATFLPLSVSVSKTSRCKLMLTARSFIGEETYSAGSTKEYIITDKPTWCVDPLDGTVNYTHLFRTSLPPSSPPYPTFQLTSHLTATFCISIAFLIHQTPMIGIIHAPLLHTTFSSLQGHGAWQDHHSPHPDIFPARRLPYINSPKKPIPENAPKGCVLGVEWGKDRRDAKGGNLERKVESFVNLATEVGGRGGKGGMVHGVRSLGR